MSIRYAKVDIERSGSEFAATFRFAFDDRKGMKLIKRVASIQDALREAAKLLDQAEAGVADA